MFKKILFILCFLPLLTQAQLVDLGIAIPHAGINTSTSKNQLSKNASNPKQCGSDTLRYAYYKGFSGPNYPSLGVSNGFAVGQYFDAPVDVEISGVTFYAFGAFNTDDSVALTVNLFEAGADTLPSGNPIRSATVYIDSIQGTLLFSRIKNVVVFDSSYISNHPYIITVESSDSLLVALVANSWTAGEGERENIACATVGGTWYNCLNLNVGGTTLDCDFLIEPHVSYEVYADFTFDDCYNVNDSLQFTNLSSPIINHRMYNRLFLNELMNYSFDYRMGDFQYHFNVENPKHKYNSPNNYQVELHTSLYRYTNYDLCYDTAIKIINYKPFTPTFKADTPVCSGNITQIDASSNGAISWHSNFSTPDTIATGSTFVSDTLQTNLLVFAEARNNQCKSTRSAINVRVIKSPDNPIAVNDSICLNAKANLSAYSNVGSIDWWSDSTLGATLLAQGNVYQTDTLNTSLKVYAQANNQGCLSPERVAVIANVNASNAPNPPHIPNDTSICLHNQSVNFSAWSAASNTINWFNQASGGVAIHTGNNYSYTPDSSGMHTIYVEENDGQCASSRIGFLVTTYQFPEKNIGSKDTLCLGDTAFFDYSGSPGSVRWYDDATAGNLIYDGDVIALSGLTSSETFYLEPYFMQCADTVRHEVVIDIIPFGTLANIQSNDICPGEVAILSASTDYGEIIWSESADMDSIVHTGYIYNLGPLTSNKTFYLAAQNYLCRSDVDTIEAVVNPKPFAGFNYQVSTPGNINFTASASGVTYDWNLGDGNYASTKSFTHQYTHNNKFNVTLITTSNKDCKDTVTRVVTVTGLMTSVDDINSDHIVIYPNPNPAKFKLYTEYSSAQLRLYNYTGTLIYSQALHHGLNEVDVQNLNFQSGVYILEIEAENTTSKKKILIY